MGQKKLGPKSFGSKKMFSLEKLFGKNMVGQKKFQIIILVQKKFGSKKVFEPKIIRAPEKF